MPDINAPYPYFANPSKGVPLANGYIYIGLPDLDPTIPANQVTITAKQEDGTNVPLVQPIRTNAGGLPTYNGGVVQLQNLVTVVYSIQVLDANMVPIYYQAQAYGIPSLGSGGTPTALTLLDGTAAMPSLAFLNNLDTGLYYVAPNELHVSIDGQDTAHFRTDVTDSELVLTSPQSASVEYFGNGEVNAFRTGVAGGFSLVMDDAGRDLLLGTSATERLRITDLGSITSGGLATATVQPGGLDLQQSGTGFIQGWRSSAVSTTIPGTGAPDEMYGWVQPVDVVGGFNVSGASGNLVGLVMTGYAGVVSTGVQTAPVMVDGRISGGGSIPAASNVFGVANNGTPIFAVLGDGSISPNPVNNIDDLLITGSLATGGAALNTAAAVNGGVTIGQTALADGYALVAQSADVAHGMTSFLPTNSYLGLGSAESDGGARMIGVGGTGTALDLTAYALTANTGATSEGVIRLTGWIKDGILAQPLASTETLFSLANGNSEVLTVLGDGTLTALGGASFGLTEIVTNLSDSLIHRNPNTVQPFTTISTDPDVYGQVKSNVIVNGGYRVFGFAASNTAAYRVDAYTAAPASGFGLDSPIRFTGYKSNGGTGSATIADTENVFSVWNQSANCLLNITGNGNTTIAGALITDGGTAVSSPVPLASGGLQLNMDGTASFGMVLTGDNISTGITSAYPDNAFGIISMAAQDDGGLAVGGITEAAYALQLSGAATTPNTTAYNTGIIQLIPSVKSGTSVTAPGANDVAVSVSVLPLSNNDLLNVLGDGRLLTASGVYTGGYIPLGTEDTGALAIYTGTADGLAQYWLNDDVVQPATSFLPANCYAAIGKRTATAGGLRLWAANSGNSGAMMFSVIQGVESTSLAQAPLRFQLLKSDGATGVTGLTGDNYACVFETNNVQLLGIRADGNVTAGGSIITGNGALPVGANTGSLTVYTGTQDSIAQYWLNNDVAHGITGIAPTNCYGAVSKTQYGSSALGGLRIDGLTEGSISIQLVGTGTTPSTSAGSGGVLDFLAQKKSGTGAVPIAGTEIGWTFSTDPTTAANRVVSIKGNGDLHTTGSIATGGETAPDVNPGGICINSPNNSGFYATMKNPNIAHGMTAIAETDTFASWAQITGGSGGVLQTAYSENNFALLINGLSTGATTANTARGTISLQAGKANGTGVQSLAANENVLTIHNNSADPVAVFKGNGDQYLDGGLAVGGGTDLLNTYEVGTWPPVIADAASGGNTATFTNNGSTYTKIGDIVHVELYVQNINTAGMTAGNTLYIRGLPFTCEEFVTCSVLCNILTFTGYVIGQTNAAASSMVFYDCNSGVNATTVKVSQVSSGNTDLLFHLTYKAA